MPPKETLTPQDFKGCRLYIGTPMYGGMCTGFYCRSQIELGCVCKAFDVPVTFDFLQGCSLTPHGRNIVAHNFLKSDATHLMFIDADTSFSAVDVFTLLWHAQGPDKPIVSALYPVKATNWAAVKSAVELGLADDDPNVLAKYGSQFVGAISQATYSTNDVVETEAAGTGFMMIRREVFEKFAEAYPERRCIDTSYGQHGQVQSCEMTAFFDASIHPETRDYVGEDYTFCRWCRDIGLKVWMCPWMTFGHIGSYNFKGSWHDYCLLQQELNKAPAKPKPSGLPSLLDVAGWAPPPLRGGLQGLFAQNGNGTKHK